jgi:Caspase domain
MTRRATPTYISYRGVPIPARFKLRLIIVLPLWTLVVGAGLVVLPGGAQTVKAQNDVRRGQGLRSQSVKMWPDSGKRWALLIGIDEYKDKQITPLNGAANDARMLAGALMRYAGFPSEQVILLASDQPLERQPTRSAILKYFSNLRGLVPKDGLLLIAFAGHGMERGGKAYLLPADALASDDPALLEDTAISVERMKDLIRAAEVSQVVMFLDACRNDPWSGRANSDNPLTSAYARSFNFLERNREVMAFASIYATSVGQRAYEYSEKKQGYFTWAIGEALSGAAASAKGEVTLGSLVSYLQEKVPIYVRRDLGIGKQQAPFAVIEGYKANELVIAVTTPDKLARPEPKSEPEQPKPGSSATGRPSPQSLNAGTDSRPAKRVLLLITEASEGRTLEDGTVARALSQKMAENNLSVTAPADLAESDLARYRRALQRLLAGAGKAGNSIPFTIAVSGTISTSPREPYQGLFVAEANGMLKAVDLKSGLVVATENISQLRGFGNTPEQAAGAALKNAAEQIAESMVKQILAVGR